MLQPVNHPELMSINHRELMYLYINHRELMYLYINHPENWRVLLILKDNLKEVKPLTWGGYTD